MDLPPPPQDTELRNIIDKLAQFVARNGPEFEQMTKSKQKGNPKFQFLYGGEYYNYYQYKVTTEQAIVLRQSGMNPQNNVAPSWNPQNNTPQASNSSVEQLTQQQETLKEQIMQSEQNLTAQHTVLMQQQQSSIDATLAKLELEELSSEAVLAGVDLEALDAILQPIIDSCTKDSISNGKGWILAHATDARRSDCIARSLLLKVLHGMVPFSQKLHVIYLVNDVLHHCARKHADELKKSLEHVVVPMFCNASVGATEEQRAKLDKLLKLWESKANYLAAATVDRLRHAAASCRQYQAQRLARYAADVARLAQATKNTFDGYQAQHQAFVSHAMQQILALQQQKQALEQQPAATIPVTSITNSTTQQNSLESLASNGHNRGTSGTLRGDVGSLGGSLGALGTSVGPLGGTIPPLGGTVGALGSGNPPISNLPPLGTNLPPISTTIPSSSVPPSLTMSPGGPTFNPAPQTILPNPNVPPPILSANGMEQPIPFNQPPPVFLPGGFPDFSKPPPGFPVPQKPEVVVEELLPSVPYYDLPAGLMIPLIKLDDASYKPIDPKAIRLPPPAPPSDRLLTAVEAFYAIPSHDRPRDSEGWEKLGLYEYYKAKNTARKVKEDAVRLGLRDRSRSPSPVQIGQPRSPSPPKRRYRSESPATVNAAANRRSRSRSPPRKRRGKKRRRSDSRSRSKSRSPQRERERSNTPPSFVPFSTCDMQELDESNKGHQMLRKMGWVGSGLGANEQGIDAPIAGGDVRDRQDLYKGVGMSLNDPYENFRKHKGAAFITRMKARAEERAQEGK